MARTFNDLSDAELGKLLRSRYDRLCQAHDMGLSEQHPSERWAEDTEVLKAHREATAQDEGGIGNVEIMKRGSADAYPPAGPDQPRSPVPDPGTSAQDSAALGVWVLGLDHVERWVPRGGVMLPGDVAVGQRSSAAPSTGASQHRMARAIPGYDRIRR